MENEKDILARDLETTNDTAGLEKLKEDAELLGHEDIAAQAQEKINALGTQAEGIRAQATAKIESAEERGGNSADLAAEVAPIQEQVKAVQTETVEKIYEIEKTTEDFSIRNPEEDVLGGILDISKLIQEGNREKIPYTDEQIKDFAEKALDEAAGEDAKKPGDYTHYIGYLDRIMKGGIDIDKEKAKQHVEGIVQKYMKDRVENQGRFPAASISNNESVVEGFGQYLDFVGGDKNRDWEGENSVGGVLQKLESFSDKEKNTYSVSGGVLRQIIEDPNVVGGMYVKEVKKSNETIDELNYTSLNEELYDALMKGWEIAHNDGKIDPSGPYSGYTARNSFTVQKLIESIKK